MHGQRKHDVGATDHRGRGQEDWRSGGVHAHQVKCKASGDPWIATRIAADIKELGYRGSRVVLKADQEVAIADAQRKWFP